MRETRLLVAVLLLGALVACADSPERHARNLASEMAAQAEHKLNPRSVKAIPAEAIARHAIEHRYDVVKVDGTDIVAAEGVKLTIRLTVHGADQGFRRDGIDRVFCYELRFQRHHEYEPKPVTCPDSPPVSYPPVPAAPRLPTPDELKALLTAAGPDEAAVEQALSKLDLDPSVRVQVSAHRGYVGVALRWDNPLTATYDCRLGRVGAGGAEAWVPAQVYLQPGEINCSGEDAALGSGQHPPR